MKSLTTMAKAISTGLIILVVLAMVLFFLKPILRDVFPPQPVEGLGIMWDAHLGKRMNFMFTMIFLSICLAGFISGFFVRVWSKKTGSRAWQSLMSGFVVGTCGSFLLLYVLVSMYPIFILDLAVNFILGLVSALVGLLGYYVASRRYHQHISG